MSKLKEVLANGKALIPFITAGDPDLETTEQLIIQMAKAGADLIEIGIPFSDPVAEGEIIQRADARSLAAGTTTDKIFSLLHSVRRACDVPVAIMTYMNPVFVYGKERFMQNCQQTGVEAVIIPDLPFEERNELSSCCTEFGIDLISMIAPTSRSRIRMIAEEAQGFVYCVSSLGVTGMRQQISTDVEGMIKLVKEVQNIPCAVGFGVSTPEQAQKISMIADGVIVGSAVVSIIEQYGRECVPHVSTYIQMMKQAVCANVS